MEENKVELKKSLPRWAWVFPVIFGIFGGIGAWIAFRKKRRNARWLIGVGLLVSVVSGMVFQTYTPPILIPEPTLVVPERQVVTVPAPVPEIHSVFLPLQPWESSDYTNLEWNFSMRYPQGWGYIEDLSIKGYPDIVVYFEGPLIRDYPISVNVVAYRDPQIAEADLKTYVEISELRSGKMFPGMEEISRSYTIRIGGVPACIVVVDIYWEEGITSRDATAYILKEDKAYLITYDAPRDGYDEHLSLFHGMLGSFRFD